MACRFVLGVMFAASIAGAWFYSTMGHDQALDMHIGRLLLSGQICFIDFYELQFPSSIFLQIFPASLERFFSLSPVFAFYLWTIGVTACSCLVSYRIGRRFRLFSSKEMMWMVIAVAGVSLSADFYSFGLREHLWMLAFFPLILLRLGRIENPVLIHWSHRLVGFWTGLCVTMKPHFLIFPLLLEFYLLFRLRADYVKLLKNEELRLFALGVIIFIFHFFALGKDYCHNWWNLSLWYGVTDYNVYNMSFSEVARTLLNTRMALFLIALFYLLMIKVPLPEKRLTIVLSLCFMGGILIYVIQQKGWIYQALPVYFFGNLIVILAARKLFRSKAAASFLISSGLIFSLGHNVMIHLAQKPPWIISYLQEKSKDDGTVWFLETGVFGTYPATLMVKKTFPGGFLWLYPLPGCYPQKISPGYHSFKQMTRLEKFTVSILYDDLITKQPNLVVMNQYGHQAMNPHFSLPEYLESIPALRKVLYASYDGQKLGNFYIYARKEN